ncbi:TIGR02391 family protein [Chloroflexota bacterium]
MYTRLSLGVEVSNMFEQFFPPPDIVLRLQPEELAIPLLKCLIHLEDTKQENNLVRENFFALPVSQRFGGEDSIEVGKVITQAWLWLEREIMIAPRPEAGAGRIVYVTDRGKILAEQANISIYIRSNLITRGVLDPQLANKIQHLFIRGDYDTAVFQAFKEVEIRVREKASLPQTLLGVELMRTAFHHETGGLTDYGQAVPERQATSHLFAGAIGLFKNPSSHRDVDWEDPQECTELIYLANHLLRIIEKHASPVRDDSPSDS